MHCQSGLNNNDHGCGPVIPAGRMRAQANRIHPKISHVSGVMYVLRRGP